MEDWHKVGGTIPSWDSVHWVGDFDGEDMGFPEVLVVGIYQSKTDPRYTYHINTESMEILEIIDEEEEE